MSVITDRAAECLAHGARSGIYVSFHLANARTNRGAGVAPLRYGLLSWERIEIRTAMPYVRQIRVLLDTR
jgi:hypothetical protein